MEKKVKRNKEIGKEKKEMLKITLNQNQAKRKKGKVDKEKEKN